MNFVRNKIYRILIIMIALASFTPISLISESAECAMIGSQMVLPDGKASVREIDEGKVRRVLENKIVVEKLKRFGLSKQEIMTKMDQMSDGEIHQLAVLSDLIPAAGDPATAAVLIVVLAFF
jgi:hypothetical protein